MLAKIENCMQPTPCARVLTTGLEALLVPHTGRRTQTFCLSIVTVHSFEIFAEVKIF